MKIALSLLVSFIILFSILTPAILPTTSSAEYIGPKFQGTLIGELPPNSEVL